MKLWHLRVNKLGARPMHFRGSFKQKIFQLWWGTHIWQFIWGKKQP